MKSLMVRKTMTEEAFQQKMRSALLALKGRMFDELSRHNHELRELNGHGPAPDLADIASEDVERRVLRSLGAIEARRLQRIEAALARLRDGKYGLCMRCGRRISRERLEAMPYALYCLDCQSEEERRRR